MKSSYQTSRVWRIGPRIAAAGLVVLLASLVPDAAALCGDGNGDGVVAATDALIALTIATGGDYQERLDVAPADAFDDQITATDALSVLVSATTGQVPRCRAATDTVAILSTASCDFVSGGVAVIDAETFDTLEHRRGIIDADAVIRQQRGRIFAVNRFGGDNIQELDADNHHSTLWQCSVVAGSNPHDIVLVSDTKGYVSRYDATSLLIIDPSTEAACTDFVVGTIGLSDLGDSDGIPEMDQMVAVDGRLFVALQRLDRNDFFRPATNAALAVIDIVTDTVIGTVELEIANPFAENKGLFYDERAERIYVGGPGTLFSDLEDGGVEIVNPATLMSEGIIATGAELGGDLTDFAMVGTRRLFAIVADGDFRASVVEFDTVTRSIVSTLAASDLLLSDIELSESGRLWLADRDCSNPGARVFEIAAMSGAAELTAAPIFPGLTPFNVLLR